MMNRKPIKLPEKAAELRQQDSIRHNQLASKLCKLGYPEHKGQDVFELELYHLEMIHIQVLNEIERGRRI
jgi:hypothetical protein